MKYPYLQHVRLLIVIFLSILFMSCKKDNTSSRPGAPSFTWTIDGVNYVADEATAFTNDIEARKTVGADVKHVEIALHSVNDFPIGTYTIGVAADIIGCWEESDPSGTGHFSTTGTLHITSSTADEVNGDFTVTLNNGSAMSGNFSHIPLE
jgi:hypothetical protein